MNFSIKSGGGYWNNTQTPPFIEEGMAVAVSWLLNPLLAQGEDHVIMQQFFAAIKSEEMLDHYVQGVLRAEKIAGLDYQPAGFFMMHVLSVAGPSAAKKMFCSSDADVALKDLKQELSAHGVSYQDFIHIMFVNGQEWRKDLAQPGIAVNEIDKMIKNSVFNE
jgi:hypothetical protein